MYFNFQIDTSPGLDAFVQYQLTRITLRTIPTNKLTLTTITKLIYM